MQLGLQDLVALAVVFAASGYLVSLAMRAVMGKPGAPLLLGLRWLRLGGRERPGPPGAAGLDRPDPEKAMIPLNCPTCRRVHPS